MSILDVDKNMEVVSTPEFERRVENSIKIKEYEYLPHMADNFITDHPTTDILGIELEPGCLVLYVEHEKTRTRFFPAIFEKFVGKSKACITYTEWADHTTQHNVSRKNLIRIR